MRTSQFKRKILLTLIVVLLLVLAYELGYWSGFSRAQRGVRVVAARDTSDTQQSSSAKAEYAPYFTRQNPIPNQMK